VLKRSREQRSVPACFASNRRCDGSAESKLGTERRSPAVSVAMEPKRHEIAILAGILVGLLAWLLVLKAFGVI
jgi:hypothetical protein